MKALTAARALQFKRIGPPELAPDGCFALASVTTDSVDDNLSPSDIWLFPLDGAEARPLTFTGNCRQPTLSPDGRYLAFLSNRSGDAAPQIYVLALNGGEARRVTQLPVGIGEFSWFPDSQNIAFVAKVLPGFTDWDTERQRLKEKAAKKSSGRVWTTTPVADWDRLVDEGSPYIFRTTREGAPPASLSFHLGVALPRWTGGPLAPGRSFSIHPAGEKIAMCIATAAPGVYQRDIALLDLKKGSARTLTLDNPGNDECPQFSPDGQRLIWLRQTIPGFYGDQRRLMVADADGQNAVRIDHDWDRSLNGLTWAADGQSLLASVEDAGVNRIYQVPLTQGRPMPLTQDCSYMAQTQALPSGISVSLRQSFTEAPNLVSLNTLTGQIRKISSINDELQADIKWGTYESISYEGADGKAIQMWVNYPPDFDPKRRYPLFLLLHGGPHSGIPDGMHWRWNAQVFAAMGYVTAWHNFHGSSGFGQEFADSISTDWASKPYEDTIKAAAWFAQKPWIDSKRMLAGGGSYGGYLATLLLGREHPFQALIAHAAVYNLYTQYGCDVHFVKKRHGDYWEDKVRFEAMSPHLQAANFRTPTLIIHGHQDYRVPLNHALELFHCLQRQGVESRLLYFPDENHWVLKPQNSLQWYEEVESWLQRFVPTSV